MQPHLTRRLALVILLPLARPLSTVEAQAAHPAAAIVTRPYSLLRHGTPGTSTTYRISRVNRMVDRRGYVTNTLEAHALVVRTLVAEVEPGLWTEDFTWRAFQMGGPPEDPTAEAAPLLRRRIDPRSVDLLDTIPAPAALDPIAAILFRVLVLDAWTWDAIVHEVRKTAGADVLLGGEFHIAGWDSARAMHLGPGAEVSYLMAPIRARMDGVTLCGREPCLRVWFRIEGNEVSQHVGTMEIDGVESFQGAAYLSLSDGRLIRGELWGPLLATMRANPDAEPMPTSGFMTEVVMEEVAEGR